MTGIERPGDCCDREAQYNPAHGSVGIVTIICLDLHTVVTFTYRATRMNDVKQNYGSLFLRLALVGPLTIAVPDNEIMQVVHWIEPAPLPFSSPSVLGVVSVQGRMFTVIDVASLLQVNYGRPEWIVALRGPEQLALSIDKAGDLIQINVQEIRPPAEFASITAGSLTRDGVTVHLLATQKLFAATLQGHERRRRRF